MTRFARRGLIATRTTSIHRFYHHLLATLMNNPCMCIWLPTAHRSAFPEAAFWGVSDIHECPDCLLLALLVLTKSYWAVSSHTISWWCYLLIQLLLGLSTAPMGPYGGVTTWRVFFPITLWLPTTPANHPYVITCGIGEKTI